MASVDIELTNFIQTSSLSSSLLRSYTEFAQKTCFKKSRTQELDSSVDGSDFFMMASNKKGNPPPAERTFQITTKELSEWDLFPVMTAKGLTRCHESDPRLCVTNLALIGDDSNVSFKNSKMKLSNKRSSPSSGAVFSGSFAGHHIYGYVSLSEAKKLVPASARNLQNILELIMLETALYRAIYRLNKQGLSQELRELMMLHELRNFHNFNSTPKLGSAFKVAFDTIKTREDYLKNLSVMWRHNFYQEAMFLSFSIACIASEHSFDDKRIAMESYSLASIAAEKNLSLTPISGELYVSSRPDKEKPSTITLNIFETVRGKLHRAYYYAGLKSITADVVFHNDNFEFQVDKMIHHASTDFTNDSTRGEILGAYASLQFVDGSFLNVFIEKKDLLEIGLMATSEAWNNVFFKRMWVKHAISEALNTCDWSPKKFIHNSKYLN